MTYGSQRIEEFGHQCPVCMFFSDAIKKFVDHRCEQTEDVDTKTPPIFVDTGDEVEVQAYGYGSKRWGRRFRRVT